MSLLTTTHSHCRDCYKCLRSCPLNAIRICKGAVQIVAERCVFDGQCLTYCPQGAIGAVGELDRVKKYLKAGDQLVASLSPMTAIALGGDISQIKDGLLKLGFAEVAPMEEAVAAFVNAYKSILAEGTKPVISSHCPAICELVEKYFPDAVNNLAPIADLVVSHARIIKSQRKGKCRVVFIGPCLAQRIREGKALDAVLTFNEITNWFKDAGVKLPSVSSEAQQGSSSGLLSLTGGLVAALDLKESAVGGKSIHISGLEACTKFLQNPPGKDSGLQFVELMACPGGCISGPFFQTNHLYDTRGRSFLSM